MEFHPETSVGFDASASAVVEPAPSGSIDEHRVHAALVAACDAVCGLFAADGDDTEQWLDIACARLLSVCRPDLEERGGRGHPFGVSGVWAGLIESDASPDEQGPSVGVAGFVDQIERDDVRERVRGHLDDPLLRRRTSRRDRNADRSDVTGVNGVGSAGALIEDEHGSCSLLIVGVVGSDGRLHRKAGTDPAVRAVCCAMARAAEERVIRPRSRRRRMTSRLSQAEQQVLELLVEGITEHEIASRLGRSRHTVHDHVRSIYKTLGMSSRNELITLWNEAGRR